MKGQERTGFSFSSLPPCKKQRVPNKLCCGDSKSMERGGGEVSLPLQPAGHEAARRVGSCLRAAQLQALAQENWARLDRYGAGILRGSPREVALISGCLGAVSRAFRAGHIQVV